MHEGTNRLLRLAGASVALTLVVFVVWRGVDQFPRLDFRTAEVWGWLGAALGLYTVTQLLGALAWREVLCAHGTVLPPGRAESQLLLSQIGKYVPGNVAHFVGRYALCREDRIPAARIGSALAMEVGILLSAAALLSTGLLLALPRVRETIMTSLGEMALGPLTFLTPLLLVPALVVLQIMLWRRAGRLKIAIAHLIIPCLLYMTNLTLMGISLWCVIGAVQPASKVDLMTLTAIFSVAWTLGFVMPGAPGGIGIRDGIVALGLGLFMGEGSALAIALAHRLLTGLGDGIIFLCGLALRAVTQKPETLP